MAMNPARWQALFFVAITVAAAVVASGIAAALAQKYSVRSDLAVMGGQRLSERTRKILSSIDQPTRLVIASDLGAADRTARERLTDVLAELEGQNRACSSTVIDTGSASGQAAYASLVSELIDQEAAALSEAAARAEAIRTAAATLATFLSQTAGPGLQKIESSLTGTSPQDRAARDYFNQAAAAVRLAARDLTESIDQSAQFMKAQLAGRNVPRTDRAAAALIRGVPPAASLLESLARELKAFAATAVDPAPANALLTQLTMQRDAAMVQTDALGRLKRPDLLRVVDALERGSAALVMQQGRGLVAVDVEALLPSSAWLAASGADMADQFRRVEELLVTALATLQYPDRPIVVFVHGEPREFLWDAPVLAIARQRLEARGADVVEWACVAREARPSLAEINAEGKRPVVYVVMSADSASDAGKAATRGGLTGVQRCERVGKAVAGLIADGQNVCVALNPSVVATYGDKDPIAAALSPMGIGAESGKPLMREQMNGPNRVIITDLVIQTAESGHPLAASIRGLPTTLPWPVVLKNQATGANQKFIPILSVPVQMGAWGESQWLSLWQTPRERRAQITDLPRPDAGRDLVAGESKDAWVVVAAAELARDNGPPQRAVVVGANSWLIDQVAGRAGVIDGRQVSLTPGNLELLDQVVSYLCGRDDLIAQSAAATSVAMVQPIDDARLLRIRLAIIVGLPGLALLVGVLIRLWRG